MLHAISCLMHHFFLMNGFSHLDRSFRSNPTVRVWGGKSFSVSTLNLPPRQAAARVVASVRSSQARVEDSCQDSCTQAVCSSHILGTVWTSTHQGPA